MLEPDALAAASCAPDPPERLELLAFATASQRLREAGVEDATGFALNVSNFVDTSENVRYGRGITRLLGDGAGFIIDTSRNGAGAAPGDEWCNPPGRKLGAAPTPDPPHEGVDALLWVKRPGESDGLCNGGPPAGEWWPEYALALARHDI